MIWLSMAEAILVISGIPENIPDNNLESTVILVVFDIDVQVEPKDSEACHQIGKPTSKTQRPIVQFVNRAFEVEQ